MIDKMLKIRQQKTYLNCSVALEDLSYLFTGDKNIFNKLRSKLTHKPVYLNTADHHRWDHHRSAEITDIEGAEKAGAEKAGIDRYIFAFLKHL